MIVLFTKYKVLRIYSNKYLYESHQIQLGVFKIKRNPEYNLQLVTHIQALFKYICSL